MIWYRYTWRTQFRRDNAMAWAILVGLGCLGLALCYTPFRFRFELLLAWIIAPRPLWFGLLSATVLTLLFRYTLPDHERAFQYAGLTLQLLGIGAVARGISQKLSTFGKTGLRAWFVEWGRQFLEIFRRSNRLQSVLAAGVGSAAGLGMAVARGQKTPSSWEEWVKFLQSEITRLDGEIKACKDALEKERQERVEADEKNRRGLEEKIAQARALAEKAMVGSFRDEIVGVIWLAYGTILATVPKEVATWW
jgi:hypothetical protein